MNARFALAALLLFVSPAAAQDTPGLTPQQRVAPPREQVGSLPAAPEEIITAVNDCSASISPGRFDRDVMRQRGWQLPSAPTTSEVRPGLNQMRALFAREGGQVIAVVNVTGSILVHCTIIARIAEAAHYDAVRSALITGLALTPANERIAEERDLIWARAMPTDQHHRLLLSASRRLALHQLEREGGQVMRIEIFPKRPLG
jgi:hypothetical protein